MLKIGWNPGWNAVKLLRGIKKTPLTWFLDWKTSHSYDFFHFIYQFHKFYGLNVTGFLILLHSIIGVGGGQGGVGAGGGGVWVGWGKGWGWGGRRQEVLKHKVSNPNHRGIENRKCMLQKHINSLGPRDAYVRQ